MLKKAGIVVAAAAATVLAVSPLAFAGESGWGHGHGDKTTNTNVNGDASKGLVNVADNNVNVPLQACNNDVPINGGVGAVQVPVKDITAAATGALAILGKAKAVSGDTIADNSRACGDNSGSAGDFHKQ